MIFSRIDRVLLGLCIAAAVIFLCAHPLKNNQFGPQSDEGYYYRYAEMVIQKGNGAFKELAAWYGSSHEARQHPMPLRVGYILPTAGLFKVFGSSYAMLGLVSTVSFLLFLAVCFYYSRKHFGWDIALVFTLFLSASPLMLGLSRRALIDSPINLLWSLALWLFLDLLSHPSRWKYAAFIFVLCLSITVKEMSVILIPFFVMAGAWARSKGMALKVWEVAGIVLIPAAVLLALYAWVLGGVEPLWTVIIGIFKAHLDPSHPSSSYAIRYCSGPWFRYILDFLLLNPVVTLLFIGYCFVFLCERGAGDWKQKYFLGYFVFVYAVMSALIHSKVVRVVVNLEMVMALFAVFMLMRVSMRYADGKRKMWLLYAVFAVFVASFSSFLQLFYFSSLLDPISYHLLWIQGFIPH